MLERTAKSNGMCKHGRKLAMDFAVRPQPCELPVGFNPHATGANKRKLVQRENMNMVPDPESIERRGYSIRGLANWILDYAAELGVPVTNMALNKLAFFALERMLVERQVLLTNARIEAWEHGPVFREIYQSFKDCGDGAISSRSKFFSPPTATFKTVHVELQPEDEALLRDALLPLIPLTASRLRAISHGEGGAWHRVWWHDGEANPGMEITPALLLEASGAEQPN
jgi:uncharacterized phage-associated protein